MRDKLGDQVAATLERAFNEDRTVTKFSKTVQVWDDTTQAWRSVTVDVKIDETALAKMLASRIIRSKSGKAAMHGNVIVAKQRERA